MSTNHSPLLPLAQRYFESDPVAAAHTLETMEEDQALSVIKALPHTLAAEAVQNMHDTFAAALLEKLPKNLFKEIVERVDIQKGAAIFLRFPQEIRHQFLEHMTEKKKKQIQEFLTYPEDSAGRIMTTEFLAFHSDVKVKDAVQKLRQIVRRHAPASYVYVIDRENKLVGVVNMRDMMLATSDQLLDQVMKKEVFSVNGFMDREKVANELASRKYFAAPVVDNENHLLGIIKAEHLLEDVQEEASEDIQKMFGAGGDERSFSSIGFSLKKRLPWLHVNLATAFLAASVVAMFEGLIAKLTVLAVYLPVVAGQGGNAGAQSLAVVMRGLVMREIPQNKAWKLVIKETWIGVINGLVIGVVTALIAWFWQGNAMLGVVVGLGMLCNLAIAGFSGAAIPITMKAIGLDPAQCSNIILTTITDCLGFFTFLGFAMIFYSYLV